MLVESKQKKSVSEINASKVHHVFNSHIKELQRNASYSTSFLQAHLLLDSYQVQNVAKKSLEQNIAQNANVEDIQKRQLEGFGMAM